MGAKDRVFFYSKHRPISAPGGEKSFTVEQCASKMKL